VVLGGTTILGSTIDLSAKYRSRRILGLQRQTCRSWPAVTSLAAWTACPPSTQEEATGTWPSDPGSSRWSACARRRRLSTHGSSPCSRASSPPGPRTAPQSRRCRRSTPGLPGEGQRRSSRPSHLLAMSRSTLWASACRSSRGSPGDSRLGTGDRSGGTSMVAIQSTAGPSPSLRSLTQNCALVGGPGSTTNLRSGFDRDDFHAGYAKNAARVAAARPRRLMISDPVTATMVADGCCAGGWPRLVASSCDARGRGPKPPEAPPGPLAASCSCRAPARPTTPRLRTRRSDRRVLGSPGDADLGDLLIDLEEDKAARAVVFGLLR
jgi:hypothetical protein